MSFDDYYLEVDRSAVGRGVLDATREELDSHVRYFAELGCPMVFTYWTGSDQAVAWREGREPLVAGVDHPSPSLALDVTPEDEDGRCSGCGAEPRYFAVSARVTEVVFDHAPDCRYAPDEEELGEE
jgi:hypothetical protein